MKRERRSEVVDFAKFLASRWLESDLSSWDPDVDITNRFTEGELLLIERTIRRIANRLSRLTKFREPRAKAGR